MADRSVPQTTGGAEERSLDVFSRFRNEMDRLFESFTGGSLFPRRTFETGSGSGSFVVPQLDVRETDKSFVVTAELPGIEEKDIEVTLADGLLKIKGEKKSETASDKDSLHVTERRYGSFQRVVRLPDAIDEEQVKASFDKGVLTVEVPKTPEAIREPKKIQIGTGKK